MGDKMVVEKRAVTDEQKAIRRQHIIDTAKTLFAVSDFKKITMAQIADTANLAKGTLFLYFKTKEAVFLSLAQQEIEKWHNRLDRELKAILQSDAHLQTHELVDLIMASLDDKILIRLLAILDDTLEQNIDSERAFEFKTFLKKRILQSGRYIEKIIPDIPRSDGAKIFHQSFICLVGAYKVCHPSQTVSLVIQKPGLEMFNRDFKETLKDMLCYHIKGFRASNKT
jgi:AcrR family transcriptional regulator